MNHSFRRILVYIHLLCAGLLFAGCALVDTNDTAVLISFVTTSERYDVLKTGSNRPMIDFEIISTVRNEGSEPFQLTGCLMPDRPVLEKNVAGTWTMVYAVGGPECLSPPFVYQKNASHTDTLHVDAMLDPDLSVGAKWESGIPVDGTYRLSRNIYGSDAALILLDEEDRVSEPFEIRVLFD